MKTYAKAIRELGYDFAIKFWADGMAGKNTPCEWFFLIAWNPSSIKQTTITLQGDDPMLMLAELIDRIKKSQADSDMRGGV